jgi:hypothetical protein
VRRHGFDLPVNARAGFAVVFHQNFHHLSRLGEP